MINSKLHTLFNKSMFIIFLCLAFILGIFLGTLQKNEVHGTLFGKDIHLDDSYFQYYNMFRQAYQILQNEYVEPNQTDAKTLFSGAIKGMLSSIEDPYTDFLSPEIAAEFSSTLNASFYGVGIRIEMRNNKLTIVAPVSGTPAAAVDIQSGDQIIAIDGQSTENITSLEAVGKIRGKLGTVVELTLLRPRTLHPFKVILKRAKISINTVEYDLIPCGKNNIAYIKLIEFGNPTDKEFKKYLKLALKSNPIGLILDVRNNPGGLLSSVSKIANTMISKGLLVYTRGRIESENHDYRASSYETIVDPKLPIIVLANQGSASASEILVGALKDTGRAKILGKTTFGKGSVQKPFELSDGSIMKYTIAKYYTPAGNVINKVGIAPDVEVDMWYDSLSDVQKTSVIQLQSETIISNFLEQNPNPAENDFQEVHKKIEQSGFNLPLDIVKCLIKQRQNAILDKTYDLEIDTQLSKALSMIENFEVTSTLDIIFFETPKTIEELQKLEQLSLENLKKDQSKY